MTNKETVKQLDESIEKIEENIKFCAKIKEQRPVSKEVHDRYIDGLVKQYLVIGMFKNSRAMFDKGIEEETTDGGD